MNYTLKQKRMQSWMLVVVAVVATAWVMPASAQIQVLTQGQKDYSSSTKIDRFRDNFSQSVPDDAELVLLVAGVTNSRDIQSVALGGIAATRVTADSGNSTGRGSIWMIKNPPVGIGRNFDVRYSSTLKQCTVGFMSFKGVDTVNPTGATFVQTGTSKPIVAGPISATNLPLHWGFVTLGVSKTDNRPDSWTFTAPNLAHQSFLNVGRPKKDDPCSTRMDFFLASNATGDRSVSYTYAENTQGSGSGVVLRPKMVTIAVSANPVAGGSATGGGTWVEGVSGSVSATANPGFAFTNWTEGGAQASTSPSYTFASTVNRTLVANFSTINRSVSYPTVTGATVSGDSSVQDSIGTASFSVNVAPGYELVGTPTANSGTVTADGANWKLTNVTANTTVSVTVQALMHTVSYAAGSGGSASGAATIQNSIGEIDIEIVPSVGYVLDGTPSATNATVTLKSGTTYTLKNATANTTVTASFKNTAPVIGVNPAGSTLECPASYSAADALNGVSVTDEEESLAVANIAVSGVTFPLTAVGTYTIRYNITDSGGLAAVEKTRTVVIEDTIKPVITLNGGNESVECGASYVDKGATASDLCDGDFAATASGSVNTDAPGSYSITYTAVDANNNAADTVTRTVTVVDTTPPAITLNGDAALEVECGAAYVDAGATADDACDGALDVETDSDVDTGTPGVYTVTYTAVDANNNEASATRTVTVVDTTAPAITLNGGALSLECSVEDYLEAGATAEDSCHGSIEVVIDSSDVDMTTPGVYSVLYTAVDANNNDVSATRTVTVLDTTPPVITLQGDNPLVLDGVAEYEEPGALATDLCGDRDYTDAIVIDNDVNLLVIGSYEISYTVEDETGNETRIVRSVEVKREDCTLVYDLQVTPNPAIPGETVKMTVVADDASCAVGDLHFQWEKRGADKGDDFLPIPNTEDLDTLVIDSVDFDDAGEYRCTISDAMIVESSAVVTLEVGTGVPALSGLGVLLASAAALAAGAAALRRKRD